VTSTTEAPIQRLIHIVEQLRSPGGCPWDKAQTHASLRSALIEECYEVVDAITLGDTANLKEELGDLLLHVVLHARIAEESGDFKLQDVAQEICEKLIRRHPHVFGDDVTAEHPDEVIAVWEKAKSLEKAGRTSIMDGIPNSLPSIMRAEKAGKKAARVGFDWKNPADVLDKVREEIDEVQVAMQAGDSEEIAEEIGDLLFSVVNLARLQKVEAELLLHSATNKFMSRFQAMEKLLAAQGGSFESESLESLEILWSRVKEDMKSSTQTVPK